ncbi:MAG: pimeloyl-ACP methyl ester carboxylesterase [Verrucomicrobiales bacterium]|jgi:pimeloyl-ACP methyl ester carboxylesterase
MIHRFLLAFFFLVSIAQADGLADNVPEKVRRIPPAGIGVPEAERVLLKAELDQLAVAMDEIKRHRLLPDVAIFHKAVRYALDYNEFQKPVELKWAHEQLAIGMRRAAALKANTSPWTRQKGLVVRGFRSKIDGSVQPYGLVIPEHYHFGKVQEYRLDFWFHGRGERTNEVAFMQERMTKIGQYAPADTIMLHPYARYSNANKFAGEIDCLEALKHVKAGYKVADKRILVRGFSMGGAACWQFAVHYPSLWCAANPGAGFSETPEFLKSFQGETLNPTPWEKKLWQLYDCTGYALNLRDLPTVAYSGEVDRQKQAADIMAIAMRARGMELTHIIGPGVAHKIHPDSKTDIAARLDKIVATPQPWSRDAIAFETYTLRYSTSHWLRIDRMGEHWKRAAFETTRTGKGIEIKTTNITALTMLPESPFDSPLQRDGQEFSIDGHTIEMPFDLNRAETHFVREGDVWKLGKPKERLAKKPALQGPIDDAFMDSFMFVAPTGEDPTKFGDWERAERARAITHWRQQFRGDARVKSDKEVSEKDIADHNLVFWGNPSSNALLAKIADQLPIKWDAKTIRVGDKSYDAKSHALIMVYPNPLNPERYIVLNSSFTYREYDYLNNARQVPKLPDWAIIDLSEKSGSQRPGRIAAAGFFDESWQLK